MYLSVRIQKCIVLLLFGVLTGNYNAFVGLSYTDVIAVKSGKFHKARLMKNSNEVVHGDRQFFVLYERTLEFLYEPFSVTSVIYL
jgi:hypothetical protein